MRRFTRWLPLVVVWFACACLARAQSDVRETYLASPAELTAHTLTYTHYEALNAISSTLNFEIVFSSVPSSASISVTPYMRGGTAGVAVTSTSTANQILKVSGLADKYVVAITWTGTVSAVTVNTTGTRGTASSGGSVNKTGSGGYVASSSTVPTDGCATFASGNIGSTGVACGSGGSSGVSTFNSRSGAIAPQSGDYTANQITGLNSAAKDSNVSSDGSGNVSGTSFTTPAGVNNAALVLPQGTGNTLPAAPGAGKIALTQKPTGAACVQTGTDATCRLLGIGSYTAGTNVTFTPQADGTTTVASTASGGTSVTLTTTGTGAATLAGSALNVPTPVVQSVTTTGTGAATLSGGVLNIPTASGGGSGSGIGLKYEYILTTPLAGDTITASTATDFATTVPFAANFFAAGDYIKIDATINIFGTDQTPTGSLYLQTALTNVNYWWDQTYGPGSMTINSNSGSPFGTMTYHWEGVIHTAGTNGTFDGKILHTWPTNKYGGSSLASLGSGYGLTIDTTSASNFHMNFSSNSPGVTVKLTSLHLTVSH